MTVIVIMTDTMMIKATMTMAQIMILTISLDARHHGSDRIYDTDE